MADAAAGVGNVARVARDDMEVELRHGLVGRRRAGPGPGADYPCHLVIASASSRMFLMRSRSLTSSYRKSFSVSMVSNSPPQPQTS